MTVKNISARSGGAVLFLCALAANPLAAQDVPATLSAQVQSERPRAAELLNQHMMRLVTNPRDYDALVGAGEAALELDDPHAAMGFFGRADDVTPGTGRAKAGLGRAMLGLGRTDDGLRLMNQAGAMGYADVAMLIDRGLARDLTGDQTGAQRDYQDALKRAPDMVVATRRLAVSQGISGQLDLAERTLHPLLYKSDRAAWRDRAFILAMNGRREQANTIATQVMPPALASAILPYMDRMTMLSNVQKAQAVHLGKFPVGLVRVAVAPPPPLPPQVAVPGVVTAAPATTAKAGDGWGKKGKRAKETPVAVAKPALPALPPPPAPPQPVVAPALGTAPVVTPPVAPPPRVVTIAPARPAVAQGVKQPDTVPPPIDYSKAEPLTPTEAPVRVAPPPVAVTAPAPAPVAPAPVASPPVVAVAPAPVPPPVAVATETPASPPAPVEVAPTPPPVADEPTSLAEIMARVEVPDTEKASSVAPVDLAEVARIQADKRKAQLAAEAKAKKDAELKAKKEAEAKAKAEAAAEKKRLAAHPARHWVKLATGTNKAGLSFDMKRLRKKHPDLLAKVGGATIADGRASVLLAGPLASPAKAKELAASLTKAGTTVFAWTSEAGEEVTPLPAK